MPLTLFSLVCMGFYQDLCHDNRPQLVYQKNQMSHGGGFPDNVSS